MKCAMKFERETKGALLYKEVNESDNSPRETDYDIGSLYIRKTSTIGKERPALITVEVLKVK